MYRLRACTYRDNAKHGKAYTRRDTHDTILPMKKREIPPHHLSISRRKLPHMQIGNTWCFVTFRTNHFQLSDDARDIVKSSILYDHGRRYTLAATTVMPDHAHILILPMETENRFYSLTAIMQGIKGSTSRRINKLSGNSGRVWQAESFDRMIRDEAEWEEKYNYILNNSIKAELAERPEEYRWVITIPDARY